MPRLTRHPALGERQIERLVAHGLDAVEPSLGFRPDVHLDWPAGRGATRGVLDAIRDALDLSLARVAAHRGTTSAFVSVAWRADTVEVCVVDDGTADPAGRPGRGQLDAHVDAPSGVEHDVDDFDGAGICQWWSIPSDL
jgi:hypothetical protein